MHIRLKPIAALFLSGVFASGAYALDIPEGELDSALHGLTSQTGIQLLYDARELQGVRTHGAHDAATPEQALRQLLEGTGLELSPADGSSFVIRRVSGVAALPTVSVTAAPYGYLAPDMIGSGTRTPTPIEHIPQSIATVTRAVIDDQGAQTISDVLRNVSNVNSVDLRDSNNAGFNVRGFRSAAVVDGVPMPGYFPNQESLVNLERIDVVKGPAGGLFGSSQGVGTSTVIGGTLAMTTRAPVSESLGQISVKAGSYGLKGAGFDLNQPISDTVAVRIDGEAQDSNSETDRVFFKRRALFPSLAYRPDADTEMVLRLRSLENSTLDFSGLPTTGTITPSTFVTPRNAIITANGLPATTNKSQGVNFQLGQRLSDNINASLLMAYNQTELDQRGVYSLACGANGALLGFALTNSQCLPAGVRLWEKFSTVTVSPSITADIDGGDIKHKITAGIDYESTKDDAYMVVSDPFGMGLMGMGLLSMTPVDLTNPVYPNWVEPVAPATPDQQNRYDSNAAYVQEQATINDKLHLLGSLRYSQIKVHDANASLLFGQNNNSTNSATTPRLGATYEFTPQISAFVGYGEGFKVPTGSLFVSPPKPEKAKQTEIGLRLKALDGITATLSAFDLVRQNVAVSNGLGQSRQAGEQRSTGVDLDLVWQVSDDWRMLTAWSKQNARITQDTVIPIGSKLFNTPQETLRLATRYDAHSGVLSGFGFGLGVTQNSRLAGDNKNTFFTPSVTVWDAQMSYTLKNIRLGLNVTNLTDNKYYVPINYFSGGVIPAQRRTFMATGSVDF